MLKEFCAENLVNVRRAIVAGAQRVELCDDLSEGGVTPRDSIIGQAVELVHGLGASVMVMVRPRGGDFAYSESELVAMERTIRRAYAHGADGVVFGCVRDGVLDVRATTRLVRMAQGLDCTFHMAFDEIRREAQPEALDVIADLGIARVLTHGGPLSLSIEQCAPHLHELIDAAAGRVRIMPGGGVTWHNVEWLCHELAVQEAHGTRIVRL